MRLCIASDLHLMADPNGQLKEVNVRENAELAFDFINSRTDIDLLVLAGDLSHDGSTESYSYISRKLSLLRMPYEVIPGNHDIDSIFARQFANLPRSVRLNSAWMIHLLDSRVTGKEAGEVSESSVRHLRTQIGATPASHLVVLHHDIFQPATPRRPGLIKGAWQLVDALTAPNVRRAAVVSGHRHQYARISIERITFVNCGAVSCQFKFDTSRPELESETPEVVFIDLDTDIKVERCVIPATRGR